MRLTWKPFPIQQNFVGHECVDILLSGTRLANKIQPGKQPGEQLDKQDSAGQTAGQTKSSRANTWLLIITAMSAGGGDARQSRLSDIDSGGATFDVGPDFVLDAALWYYPLIHSAAGLRS